MSDQHSQKEEVKSIFWWKKRSLKEQVGREMKGWFYIVVFLAALLLIFVLI